MTSKRPARPGPWTCPHKWFKWLKHGYAVKTTPKKSPENITKDKIKLSKVVIVSLRPLARLNNQKVKRKSPQSCKRNQNQSKKETNKPKKHNSTPFTNKSRACKYQGFERGIGFHKKFVKFLSEGS